MSDDKPKPPSASLFDVLPSGSVRKRPRKLGKWRPYRRPFGLPPDPFYDIENVLNYVFYDRRSTLEEREMAFRALDNGWHAEPMAVVGCMWIVLDRRRRGERLDWRVQRSAEDLQDCLLSQHPDVLPLGNGTAIVMKKRPTNPYRHWDEWAAPERSGE